MTSRILTESDRQKRAAQRALLQLAGMHAAIVQIAKRARAGQMEVPRALALIEALIDEHAIAQWVPTGKPNESRLTIVASDTAPPEARALLEQAQLPKLDPVDRSMILALQGGRR